MRKGNLFRTLSETVNATRGTRPYNLLPANLWHDGLVLDKPVLIAKLRVGSTVSGECSLCHEVIVVVQDPAGESAAQKCDTLQQAFEEHVHKNANDTLIV